MISFLWQMLFSKWQTVMVNSALNWWISPYILGKFHQHSLRQNFGEIERQIFCQTLCAGNFSLQKQSLMKLSPGVKLVSNDSLLQGKKIWLCLLKEKIAESLNKPNFSPTKGLTSFLSFLFSQTKQKNFYSYIDFILFDMYRYFVTTKTLKNMTKTYMCKV